jgi:hypothetical protein
MRNQAALPDYELGPHLKWQPPRPNLFNRLYRVVLGRPGPTIKRLYADAKSARPNTHPLEIEATLESRVGMEISYD